MRKAAVNILKFALTAGLIYWLIRSGNLRLDGLRGAFDHPGWLVGGVLSVGVMVLASTVRWHLLLTAQNIPIPFSGTTKLTFIGHFFTTVIPGGISGDLMKVYYIGERFPSSRSATFLSIIGDRILGLSSLMFFGLIALALRWDLVLSSPQIRSIGVLTSLYFCGLAVLLPVILSPRIRRHRFTEAVLRRLPLSSFITRLYDALHIYKQRKAHIAGAVFASSLVAFFSAFTFYCFGQSLEISTLGLADYCLVIPLIFIIISVPISPGGIGIGQAAALFIFRWVGSADDSFGADLMTMYQASVMLFALAGAIVFLLHKNEMHTKELTESTQVG